MQQILVVLVIQFGFAKLITEQCFALSLPLPFFVVAAFNTTKILYFSYYLYDINYISSWLINLINFLQNASALLNDVVVDALNAGDTKSIVTAFSSSESE